MTGLRTLIARLRLARLSRIAVVAGVIGVVLGVGALLLRPSDRDSRTPSSPSTAAAAIIASPESSNQGIAAGTPGISPGPATASHTPHPVATPTPPPPPQGCSAENFALSITTDKQSYTQGDTVWVSLVATNRGPACQLINDCIPFVRVRDAAGDEIATTMTPPGPCLKYPQEAIKHDGKLTHSYPWNQQPLNANGTYTTGTEVPRGSYRLTVDWHSLGLGPTVAITLAQ